MTGRPREHQVRPGQRFGLLTVIREIPGTGRPVECVCDCGTPVLTRVQTLIAGKVKACGCNRLGRARTHGFGMHPLYSTWWQMIARCENPQAPGYRYWGGRGIRVCDDWHDVGAFVGWIEANIGPRPAGTVGTKRRSPLYTLDRIDNDGNYEPGNVRWATRAEQTANSRMRPAKPRTLKGRRRHLPEQGQRFGRLAVVAEMPGSKPRLIACRCDCGQFKIANIYALINGSTRSCGCLRYETATARLAEINHTLTA